MLCFQNFQSKEKYNSENQFGKKIRGEEEKNGCENCEHIEHLYQFNDRKGKRQHKIKTRKSQIGNQSTDHRAFIE